MSKIIDRIRNDPRVVEVWHEGEDGWWLTLAPGFTNPIAECHTVHELTITELRRSFRAVRPCDRADCSDCRVTTKQGGAA